MKYLLFALPLIAVGCTKPEVVENTTQALDFTSNVGNMVAASGVPFAGAIGAVALFASTSIKGWFNTRSEKKKNSAQYVAVNAIHSEVEYIKNSMDKGTLTVDDAVAALTGLVKNTATVVHESMGVKDAIKKDLDKKGL